MATLVRSEATPARTSQVRRVVRVAAGNALEMYDFQIFAYYAAAIAAGADHFVAKPFSPSVMCRLVESVLAAWEDSRGVIDVSAAEA